MFSSPFPWKFHCSQVPNCSSVLPSVFPPFPIPAGTVIFMCHSPWDGSTKKKKIFFSKHSLQIGAGRTQPPHPNIPVPVGTWLGDSSRWKGSPWAPKSRNNKREGAQLVALVPFPVTNSPSPSCHVWAVPLFHLNFLLCYHKNLLQAGLTGSTN